MLRAALSERGRIRGSRSSASSSSQRRGLGVEGDRQVLAGADPGRLAGELDGAVQAPQLVDQAEALGVRAGPDAAGGDRLDRLLARHLAAGGDVADEGVVDPPMSRWMRAACSGV